MLVFGIKEVNGIFYTIHSVRCPALPLVK
jgi:hypothetical protein